MRDPSFYQYNTLRTYPDNRRYTTSFHCLLRTYVVEFFKKLSNLVDDICFVIPVGLVGMVKYMDLVCAVPAFVPGPLQIGKVFQMDGNKVRNTATTYENAQRGTLTSRSLRNCVPSI